VAWDNSRAASATIEKIDPGSSTTLTLTRSRLAFRYLACRRLGTERGLQFPHRGLEARDLPAVAGAGDRTAAATKDYPDQHEWGSPPRLRRITYIPALLLANTIVMFSPLVRRELAEDWLVGWTAKKCVLAPLPPNIAAPPGSRRPGSRDDPGDRAGPGDRAFEAAAASRRRATDGRLLIGHFGSIYPGKQPNALLRIGAILKQRGLKPLLVYIGSFIRGVDRVEEEFHALAAELGSTRT